MPDTLSQDDMEALRKRRREEDKQAEAFDQDPGGGDNICISCE